MSEKLEELCQPIVDYLKKRHPYCYVVVSQGEIKLLETTIRVPVQEEG